MLSVWKCFAGKIFFKVNNYAWNLSFVFTSVFNGRLQIQILSYSVIFLGKPFLYLIWLLNKSLRYEAVPVLIKIITIM
jgi:hypothetical protein